MDNPSVKKASSGNSTIALAVIIGIIIGFLVDQLVPSAKTQADSANINASIAQYISDNPEAIETALIALNDQRNRDKELQALNLLSAVEDTTVMGNPGWRYHHL
jgi:uncharacterized membrane protein YgaE (UPF0421/DUF939 family)